MHNKRRLNCTIWQDRSVFKSDFYLRSSDLFRLISHKALSNSVIERLKIIAAIFCILSEIASTMSYRKGVKYLILFLVLMFLNSHPGNSQANNSTVLLNSRIDSLLRSAENSLNKNLAEALLSARNAKRIAINASDTNRIIRAVCLESIVKARTNQSNSALSNLTNLETDFKARMDSASWAEIFAAKGMTYYLLSSFDSSKVNFEKAIHIFQNIGNQLRAGFELNQLARVYLRSGESKNAITVSEESSRIFENSANMEGRALSLDLKGEILKSQRLYDKALEVHQASLVIFKSIHHLAGIAISEVHIGNAWYMNAIDDSALLYYNRALKNYRLLGDSNGIAICYANLSRVFLEKNELQQSIYFANLTLTTIQGGDYKLIESTTFQQLGDIYGELEQYGKAIIFLNKALDLANSINHKTTIMDCRKSLSEVFYSIRNTDSAYINLLEAYHLKDTLQPLAYTRQLAELQDKYESEKQQVVLNSLQQNDRIKSLEISDQQNQINRRNTIIISGVIIVLLLGFVIYLATQRQKLALVLEKAAVVKRTEEKERIRFARDLHDDVGSGLSKISFLSSLLVSSNALSPSNTEKVLSISETSKDLVDNMRDLIWTLNPENTTLENLVARIREFASDYLEEFPMNIQFDFPEHTPDLVLSKESYREIFMTVKECLNNIVKHSQATMVSMLIEIKNEGFIVHIIDNGIGLIVNEVARGNGISNMTNRIIGIGGEFSIGKNSSGGVIVCILVPVDKLVVS